jgi:hypothetical protein
MLNIPFPLLGIRTGTMEEQMNGRVGDGGWMRGGGFTARRVLKLSVEETAFGTGERRYVETDS